MLQLEVVNEFEHGLKYGTTTNEQIKARPAESGNSSRADAQRDTAKNKGIKLESRFRYTPLAILFEHYALTISFAKSVNVIIDNRSVLFAKQCINIFTRLFAED